MKTYPSLLLALLAPLAYLLVAMLLAALLAVPVFGALNGSLPLEKIASKLTQLFLILGIYPVWRIAGFSKQEIGFCKDFRSNLNQLLSGLMFGLATLSVIAALLFILEIRVTDPDFAWSLPEILQLLLGSLLTGILVSVLEEPLFRGVLLAGLMRLTSLTAALALTAFFYAALHFFKPEITLPPAQISWSTGLLLIPDAFTQAMNWNNLDSFLALFAVGLFLSTLRTLVPRSLAFCVGIHAGWVTMIKLTKSATDGNDQAAASFLVGNYDGITGILVTLWMMILTIAIYYYRDLLGQILNKDN